MDMAACGPEVVREPRFYMDSADVSSCQLSAVSFQHHRCVWESGRLRAESYRMTLRSVGVGGVRPATLSTTPRDRLTMNSSPAASTPNELMLPS